MIRSPKDSNPGYIVGQGKIAQLRTDRNTIGPIFYQMLLIRIVHLCRRKQITIILSRQYYFSNQFNFPSGCQLPFYITAAADATLPLPIHILSPGLTTFSLQTKMHPQAIYSNTARSQDTLPHTCTNYHLDTPLSQSPTTRNSISQYPQLTSRNRTLTH